MEISQTLPAGRQIVESYGAGRFTVSGETFSGAILVFPDRTLDWDVSAVEQVSAESLSAVLEADPAVEVLLLGCGARMAQVPRPLREALRAGGVALEPMDTGAACRTYNVLVAEERRVAAALIPVD